MTRLEEIEDMAFRTFYRAGTIHAGVDNADDLARLNGVVRQRDMLAEYARRKANGEFPDGPEVRW